MQIVRYASLEPVPWKNGGGVTREVERRPRQGRWTWRLSMAEVGESGPFSDYSGYRRLMVLLAGEGIVLRFGDGSQRALRTPGELIEFSGGLPTSGVLVEGPCVDLNLMVDEALPRPAAGVVALPQTLSPAAVSGMLRVVVALEAGIEMRVGGSDGSALALGKWDTALLAPEEGPVALAVSASAGMPWGGNPRAFVATVPGE